MEDVACPSDIGWRSFGSLDERCEIAREALIQGGNLPRIVPIDPFPVCFTGPGRWVGADDGRTVSDVLPAWKEMDRRPLPVSNLQRIDSVDADGRRVNMVGSLPDGSMATVTRVLAVVAQGKRFIALGNSKHAEYVPANTATDSGAADRRTVWAVGGSNYSGNWILVTR